MANVVSPYSSLKGAEQVLWVELCLPRMRSRQQFKAGGYDDEE
jgi:hypothetical protein